MTAILIGYIRLFPKDAARKVSVFPFISTFITTVISGCIFALIAAFFILHSPNMVMVMLPIILGTAVFNAIVVEVLYTPLKIVLHK